jgi:AraC-like DNA-binding protein
MPNTSYSFYKADYPSQGMEREFPVEISSTGHETRSSRDYRWNNERHSYSRTHILQYTLAGRGRFEFSRDGGRFRESVGPGRMFIASWDGEFEYFFEGGEPWEFLWISLEGTFADRAASFLRDPLPVLDLPAESSPVVFLKGLQERLAGAYRMDHYALTSLGYEFLARLLKEKSRSAFSPEERFLQEARAFVARSIRTASVGSLARHFGYSEKYFNEYFKRRASTTPNRFIVEQRIRYASSLLVGTRKKIAAVAEESGFAEDNYFSKVFKRHRGLPPAEYRGKNRDALPVDEIVIL